MVPVLEKPTVVTAEMTCTSKFKHIPVSSPCLLWKVEQKSKGTSLNSEDATKMSTGQQKIKLLARSLLVGYTVAPVSSGTFHKRAMEP